MNEAETYWCEKEKKSMRDLVPKREKLLKWRVQVLISREEEKKKKRKLVQ